jgi:cytosine/adenosine deaminase-related metal-dependent hydrolase
MSDLAIRARWALVGDRVEADRWIVVENGHIAAVLGERPSAARVIDKPDLLVLPGLINLHNHVFTEMLIRGRSEDVESETYETYLVYGLLMPYGQAAMRHLSAEETKAIADFGLMQFAKGGVTTLMEPFRAGLTDAFVAAAKQAGLRFYAAPYLFSTPDLNVGADGRPTYGGDADASSLAEWRRLHERYDEGADGRVRVALAPHGTDTCGPDLMREVRRLADATGALATTHLSQSRSEIEVIAQRYGGRTPPEYLDWCGLLGPDVLVAHCIFATDHDLDLLKRTDTTIVSCPRSYARGGVTAAYGRFQGRGIRTVVATDGYDLDLIGELRMAGMVSKLAARDGGIATARMLVGAVTRDAATALRRADIGEIAPGKRADLVAVDLGAPHLVPVSDPLKALVWRATSQDVWATVADGRLAVDEGRYLLGDEQAIAAAGRAAVEKVWAAARV